jgi:uncharacterized protein YndB with AHSA1/START domain
VPEIAHEAEIDCDAERIFDLIADFGGQARWLRKSSAYRGTLDISSDPVTLGTTYREPGPLGVRNGEVAEFERPAKLAFHQPMTMRFGLGTVEIMMRYALTAQGERTHVRRAVTFEFPGLLKPVGPVAALLFKRESGRTLRALKSYADGL